MPEKKNANITMLIYIIIFWVILYGIILLIDYLNKEEPIIEKTSQNAYEQQLGIKEDVALKEFLVAPLYYADTFIERKGLYIKNENTNIIYKEDFNIEEGSKVLYIFDDKRSLQDFYVVEDMITTALTEEELLPIIEKSINKDYIQHLTIGGEYIVVDQSKGEEVRKALEGREIDEKYFIRVGNNKIFPEQGKYNIRYFVLEDSLFVDYITIGQYYSDKEKEILGNYKNQYQSITDKKILDKFIATHQNQYPLLFPTK